MQPEESSTEFPPPEHPEDTQQQPASRRGIAILTACAILALPLGYLILHKAKPSTVSAAMPAANAPDIPSLEAAVKANPSVANRINLSLAYINGDMPIRAVPVLQAVIAADPNNLIAWNNLCVAHVMQQDYKPALEECQHAVQIDPTYQLAQNNLKWAQDENSKTIQSLATMEQTEPAARDAKFYVTEGIQFLHVGDYQESIHAWQLALAHDPKNAIAANDIGTSYMFMNQPKQGLVWFQKALTMDPAFQLAQNNIAWANAEIAKEK